MKKVIKFITNKVSVIQEEQEKAQKKEAKKKKITIKPRKKEENKKIEIFVSSRTVAKVLFIFVLFMAGIKVLGKLQTLLIMTSISAILTLGITPVVEQLEKRKIPRPIAIFILYIVFLGAISVLFIQIIPIISKQLMDIAYDLRHFVLSDDMKLPLLERLNINFDINEIKNLIASNLTNISQNLQNVAGSTFGIISSVFQGVFNFIFTLTILFFMLLERERLSRGIIQFFPHHNQEYIVHKTLSVQKKMAEWFKGQFILMLSMGTFVYIGMLILGWTVDMEYAATIGILAAFAELLPYVGPFATYFLVGLISINISWMTFILGLGFVFVAQMLEGNILVPLVMRKAVGLPGLITLLALAIGGVLGYAAGGISVSIVGMIFSVPIAASIAIFIEEDAPHNE